MQLTPFTIEEATEICEDFEDLKDTEFTIGSSSVYLAEDVVISPFEEEEKKIFIGQYLATKNAYVSLSMYTGGSYDVIVMAYDMDNETDYIHVNIRTYAAEKGIRYSFPVHP